MSVRNLIYTIFSDLIKINRNYSYLNSGQYDTLYNRSKFTLSCLFNASLRNKALEKIKKRENELDSARFNSFLFILKHYNTSTQFFFSRIANLQYALANALIEGEFCEFGVYKGDSLQIIANSTNHPIHGFDSFEGLPENWSNWMPKGAFKLQQSDYKTLVFPSNVILHKGLFEDTLPYFKAQLGSKPLAFIHIDSDLYSSAKTIFRYLGENIVRGTIIVFDEFLGYPDWENGEYKAFTEFISDNKINFEYISFNVVSEQVTVRIL